MRLHKFLAHAGVASRRRSEELIESGRVLVNGKPVRELGTSVAEGDRIEVDGRRVEISRAKRYLVLHKPVNVVTTLRDPQGRRTVSTLIPTSEGRLVPVGRLDYDTSGVLLMTSDGELAHVLTHPRFGVEKTYRALISGRLDAQDVRRLLDGLRLDDGVAAPAKIRVVRTAATASELDITIHEGRNRQVRRMLEATEHRVLSLVRLRFGPLSLGDLRVGHWREVTPRELSALRALRAGAKEDEDG